MLTWIRFDPASLEILRQLGQIISSQDELLQTVHSVAATRSQCAASALSPAVPAHPHARAVGDGLSWDGGGGAHSQQQLLSVTQDWSGAQTDSASTTPAASASVAAVRWFGLLTNDASREAFQEADMPLGVEGGILDPSVGEDESQMTPLQRATRIIDSQPTAGEFPNQVTSPASVSTNLKEERLWQASENICLLDQEQILFENFLHRICPWVCHTSHLRAIVADSRMKARPLRPGAHVFHQSAAPLCPKCRPIECNIGTFLLSPVPRRAH